jgi:hypothetical protein
MELTFTLTAQYEFELRQNGKMWTTLELGITKQYNVLNYVKMELNWKTKMLISARIH